MEKLKRPKKTEGETIRINSGCGHMYVTITKVNGKIFEVFASLGKGGGCAVAQLEGMTSAITVGLRYGVPVTEYIKQLENIRCVAPALDPNPEIDESEPILSCADAIAKALKWQNSVVKNEKKGEKGETNDKA